MSIYLLCSHSCHEEKRAYKCARMLVAFLYLTETKILCPKRGPCQRVPRINYRSRVQWQAHLKGSLYTCTRKLLPLVGPLVMFVCVYWHHVLANHQSFACAWIHAFLSGRCQSAPFILPLLSFAYTFPNTNIKNNHYYNMCCLHALFFSRDIQL